MKGGDKMTKITDKKSLRFQYENGITTTGKTKYTSYSISNINKDCSYESLYGIKELIEKIQIKPIAKLNVVEVYELKA